MTTRKIQNWRPLDWGFLQRVIDRLGLLETSRKRLNSTLYEVKRVLPKLYWWITKIGMFSNRPEDCASKRYTDKWGRPNSACIHTLPSAYIV